MLKIENRVFEQGRLDDLKRDLKDKDYRRKLFGEIVPENRIN